MLTTTSRLTGSTITATDGPLGHVTSTFFDDQRWAIRYLVVDTGSWLSGRKVLISPYAVKQCVNSGRNLDVWLTREQVTNSPDIDVHQPVSRQHERELLGFYDYPMYWGNDGIWSAGNYPRRPTTLPSAREIEARRALRESDALAADVHLRSTVEVTGYNIQASDDSIGHVSDFVFDDESWAIRYLLVDTRNWWPGGRRVLIGTHWIDRIDWNTEAITVNLTREQVRASPVYEEGTTLTRDHERRLHSAYERRGYWN